MIRLSYYKCTDYHSELIKKAERERLVKKFRKTSGKKDQILGVVDRLYQPRFQTSRGLGRCAQWQRSVKINIPAD